MAVKENILEIKEKLINEINGFSESELYTVQGYFDYLKIKNLEATEDSTPLDDFDYELSRRADENEEKEFVPFETVLESCGLTYADLQD